MTTAEFRCSAEALTRAEPLFATASLVSAWLLIEQPGAWGPDALTESRFPAEIGQELQRRASGVRILLIRRRNGGDGGSKMFKAHSGSDIRDPVMVSAPLPNPEMLLELDFEGLSTGEVGPGDRVDEPLYLVCTHGRHDICCADNGRPLYRTLSDIRPHQTWEVSHLGGDRFAGNLLVLPRGDYFGRVEPDHAESLVSQYENGRLDLTHYRGRSTQPRLVQAAEHFVRESEGLSEIGALPLAEYRRSSGDRAEVLFALPSGAVRVHVVARALPEGTFLTCSASAPGHPVAYRLVSMARE